MKMLSIDTSTNYCSAAIVVNDKITYLEQLAPKQHTQIILPMVNQLLVNAGLALSQLDALAFAAGPGSFTGIRIAAGVIQGLAFGADLPVVSVSTLATIAQGAYRQFDARKILSALDARMNQIYFGFYQINEQGVAEAIISDGLCDVGACPLTLENDMIRVGSGWGSDFPPLARDVIPIAKAKFHRGEILPAELALPVYIRDNVVRL